jgi:hypothetical protein
LIVTGTPGSRAKRFVTPDRCVATLRVGERILAAIHGNRIQVRIPRADPLDHAADHVRTRKVASRDPPRGSTALSRQ